jgi:hypothetical protein
LFKPAFPQAFFQTMFLWQQTMATLQKASLLRVAILVLVEKFGFELAVDSEFISDVQRSGFAKLDASRSSRWPNNQPAPLLRVVARLPPI